MRPRLILSLVASGALALGGAACGSSSSSSSGSGSGGSTTTKASGGGTINGAGSTFAAPIYQTWGSKLSGQGVTVNYAPVGSGAGVQQWTAGTADFAGTDPPLKDPEVAAAAAKGQPVHVPTALGAITISYNLQGVSKLKLDGKTAADIFLGKVKTWNDPEIKALNAGATLPSTPITVVHRSDSSGTTKGFTDFLAAYSPGWKRTVGADKSVKWPVGTGGQGNLGVASAIKQQQGSIGYVEQAYALKNGFTFASVKNRAGQFVDPTLASTTAAGANLKVPADLRLSAIDAPGASAYPIVSQTFIVVHQDLCKGGVSQGTATALVKFLNYGLGQGQQDAQQLSYAPLPGPLLAKAKKAVSSLQCNGAPITA